MAFTPWNTLLSEIVAGLPVKASTFRKHIENHRGLDNTTWTPYTVVNPIHGSGNNVFYSSLTGVYKMVGSDTMMIRIRGVVRTVDSSNDPNSNASFSLPPGWKVIASPIHDWVGNFKGGIAGPSGVGDQESMALRAIGDATAMTVTFDHYNSSPQGFFASEVLTWNNLFRMGSVHTLDAILQVEEIP